MSLTIRDDRHRNVGEEGQVPLGGSEASKNWEAHVLNIPCNVDLKILGSELEVKKSPHPTSYKTRVNFQQETSYK